MSYIIVAFILGVIGGLIGPLVARSLCRVSYQKKMKAIRDKIAEAIKRQSQ